MLFCSWHTPQQRDLMVTEQVNKIYDEHEAELKAKDKEINHLKYLFHSGDEHGAEINLRICNKYVSKRFTETEISQIILLDQYLKDTFENMLEMLKDNA